MDIKQLEKLKKSLPPGALSEIANNLNLSVSLVSYVLNGKRQNESVIQEAIELAKKHKDKIAKQVDSINQL